MTNWKRLSILGFFFICGSLWIAAQDDYDIIDYGKAYEQGSDGSLTEVKPGSGESASVFIFQSPSDDMGGSSVSGFVGEISFDSFLPDGTPFWTANSGESFSFETNGNPLDATSSFLNQSMGGNDQAGSGGVFSNFFSGFGDGGFEDTFLPGHIPSDQFNGIDVFGTDLGLESFGAGVASFLNPGSPVFDMNAIGPKFSFESLEDADSPVKDLNLADASFGEGFENSKLPLPWDEGREIQRFSSIPKIETFSSLDLPAVATENSGSDDDETSPRSETRSNEDLSRMRSILEQVPGEGGGRSFENLSSTNFIEQLRRQDGDMVDQRISDTRGRAKEVRASIEGVQTSGGDKAKAVTVLNSADDLLDFADEVLDEGDPRRADRIAGKAGDLIDLAWGVARIGVGFIPVVGDAVDITEAVTGVDLFTGEKLSTAERVVTLAGLIAGSGAAYRAAFKSGKQVLNSAADLSSRVKRIGKLNNGLPVNPKINPGHQGKHIRGGHNFDPHRSEWTGGDPQHAVNQKIGTGQKLLDKKTGKKWTQKERVSFDRPIGRYVDPADPGRGVETSNALIHYGKNGTHIVPARP